MIETLEKPAYVENYIQEKKVIEPFAGGQTDFLAIWYMIFEAMFGGEAGPGKSWDLIIDVLGLQYKSILGCYAIEIPRYRGVLFRRETGELSDLLDECHEYYPDFNGTYTASRKGDPGPCYTFPSGAKIYLCHLQQEEDKRKHKGKEYQYVGFDELTQFTITQYLYLFTRARSTIPGLHPRLRSTTNPEGPGLWWVLKRFIRCIENPGEVQYYRESLSEDPEQNPEGVLSNKTDPQALARLHIPGYREQNLILAKDKAYESRIRAVGPRYAKALLGHDWYAFVGDFFAKEFNALRDIEDPFKIDKNWRLIGALDPGWSSPCAFSLIAQDFTGTIHLVATYYEAGRSPSQNAKAIREFISNCKYTDGREPEYIVSGLDAWARKDRYAIMGTEKTFADCFEAEGIVLTECINDRIPGWWALKDTMLQDKFKVFRTTNQPFLDEIRSVPIDEKNHDDISGRGNDASVKDHALDEIRYGNMSLYEPKKPKAMGSGRAGTRQTTKQSKKSSFTKF